MSRTAINAALCSLLLMGWNNLALAEHADRDKPIHVESDRVVIDDAKQTSVFEGQVELTQGTLFIQAEKIVLTQDKLGNKHCTATGSPANFRQKHEGTDQYMEGYGDRIEYDTRTETVDFFGHARVKRDQDDVQGDHIAYSTRTEVFEVSGDPTRLNDPDKGRAHAVIQPKAKEPASGSAAPLTIQTSPTLSKQKP
ncbi:lipopolysaccharide transport periplasmic protein LptA [Sideroxydans lithotrophicus]|uniref:Lipopolysaccharide export system protein LptA n=1 Tax=Sideroxydans lithotrophicus (strain ES-1) TaxID=580332 RepID=D5CM65_SIDLE|nr:lipopolysaccharide transport periplasmic protein LptA [Sideroxydans lithotrophicus]ADE10679.1 lipopolysaccharide transport periplasmic protein LptA [Sideroxydans lithotrophicus ES-1]